MVRRHSLLTFLAAAALAAITFGTARPARADPVMSTGALGALNPSSSIVFNTDTGTYTIDGGPAIGGGRLDAGVPGTAPTTRLYDFTSITIGPGVTFVSTGHYSLGLLGTGDITIGATLPLEGQNGGNGANGTGLIGGGGEGGGGGGGALLVDSNTGKITLSGSLDLQGGKDGLHGSANLPGPSGGGQGGHGGAAGVGGGAGGNGGSSVAGGVGGAGGAGAGTEAGGGGGGGGGDNGAGGALGGVGTITAPPAGATAVGNPGGAKGTGGVSGKKGMIFNTVTSTGGDGGKGGDATRGGGEDGAIGKDGKGTSAGGGGGGGGGDDLSGAAKTAGKGMKGGKPTAGGTAGAAGTNGSSGGGGVFFFAAPGGVEIDGSILVGTGAGAIFGMLKGTGMFDRPVVSQTDPLNPTSINTVNTYSYAAFQGLTPSDFTLTGGGGAGGGGGDGTVLPEPSVIHLTGLGVLVLLGYGALRRGTPAVPAGATRGDTE